jgi:hypothetical protein
VPLLLAVLPDRSLIPTAWTDWTGHGAEALEETDGGDHLCAVSDLLKARAVIDALLSRLAESAPRQEGDNAIGIGIARLSIGVEI